LQPIFTVRELMATLESIQTKIAKLQAQAEALVATKSTVVLERIRGLMEKHDVSVADIEEHVGKRRGRKPGGAASAKQSTSEAKYRDPKTGATWSGRGRAPGWIANANDRTKFLVVSGAAVSPASAKKTLKPGNYLRGPQPALYRDPKTGATWSGRGRAPAWLAGVKDRAKYLIAEAAEFPAAPKAKASKAVTAKKVTATRRAPAKKAAAKTVVVPTRKVTKKNGATAKVPVARKPRVSKGAAKAERTNSAAVSQVSAEVASTPDAI
jgi:DNA-binding protein H-NS